MEKKVAEEKMKYYNSSFRTFEATYLTFIITKILVFVLVMNPPKIGSLPLIWYFAYISLQAPIFFLNALSIKNLHKTGLPLEESKILRYLILIAFITSWVIILKVDPTLPLNVLILSYIIWISFIVPSILTRLDRKYTRIFLLNEKLKSSVAVSLMILYGIFTIIFIFELGLL
ncbi:MAG: hypothetical protein ACOC53_06750 [Candidatus Saliniplasma sp.]